MGKYITPTMIIRSHILLRASLPMDTGNLRYNGTTRGMYPGGFKLEVGGHRAPYFEFLQDRTWSKYYNTFENKNFTPVFRYLETALHGEFGGGRFLQKKGVKKITPKVEREQFRLEFENTEARDAVASRYGD
jgi:hypothetical protein